jgi:hypothetical protein
MSFRADAERSRNTSRNPLPDEMLKQVQHDGIPIDLLPFTNEEQISHTPSK